jgi:protein-S-isoprenylcysteine O-methyltransferase Ste14
MTIYLQILAGGTKPGLMVLAGIPDDLQIYLKIIVGIWIVFFALLFLPALRGGIPVEKRSSRYMQWSLIVAIVIVILVLVLGTFESDALVLRVIPDSPLAGIAGIILVLAGFGFSGWARHHLGRYWSSMVEVKVGHQLIRTGPYRFVRNPMYTGILIAFLGAAIAIGEVLAFVALAIGIASIWVKIKAEEQILTEKFGEEYLQYKREVKALIPFVV